MLPTWLLLQTCPWLSCGHGELWEPSGLPCTVSHSWPAADDTLGIGLWLCAPLGMPGGPRFRLPDLETCPPTSPQLALPGEAWCPLGAAVCHCLKHSALWPQPHPLLPEVSGHQVTAAILPLVASLGSLGAAATSNYSQAALRDRLGCVGSLRPTLPLKADPSPGTREQDSDTGLQGPLDCWGWETGLAWGPHVGRVATRPKWLLSHRRCSRVSLVAPRGITW